MSLTHVACATCHDQSQNASAGSASRGRREEGRGCSSGSLSGGCSWIVTQTALPRRRARQGSSDANGLRHFVLDRIDTRDGSVPSVGDPDRAGRDSKTAWLPADRDRGFDGARLRVEPHDGVVERVRDPYSSGTSAIAVGRIPTASFWVAPVRSIRVTVLFTASVTQAAPAS